MPKKFRPMNMTVRFVEPGGSVATATISAFCVSCGGYRGKPKIEQIFDNYGDPLLVHRWKNKCGHQDTDDSIFAEIESQCAAEGCVMLTSSAVHYPYCGEECVVNAGLNVITILRNVSQRLDGIIETAQAMTAMITHPDLEVPADLNREGALELWHKTIDNTADAVGRAQINIIEAISHVINGHTMDGTQNYV